MPSVDAVSRVDLLTAVMHEFGHVLGEGHSAGDDVMEERLSPGTRRLPLSLFED